MSGVESRYARALFETARSEGNGRGARYGELLDSFVRMLEENASVKEFLTSGQKSRVERNRFLDSVFTDRDDRTFFGFLKVLVDKERMDRLAAISLDYRRLELDSRDIREALIESAFPVDEETAQTIAEAFRKKTGAREIRTTIRIVPDLVGGIRVSIGSAVYDGSIRGQLDKLHGLITE